MSKPHFVVIKNASKQAELKPMKAWLRENPELVPEGRDANRDTSYQLRRALIKMGWELEEMDHKVLLIKPDESGDTSFADDLVEDVDTKTEETESDVADAVEITFSLERDLQAALRNNIAQLEPGLRIIDKGIERITEAGRIDITAEDRNNQHVVIELKAGTANPEVIAQILAYMSAVAEEDSKSVRGILIAGDFHKRVILAARAIPNLLLKRYSFKFAFSDVG